MSFIQKLIQKLFSSSNAYHILNSSYINNQKSKNENLKTPSYLSVEELAKYFNISAKDMIEIFLTLPTPWVEKTSKGYTPTKEGYNQGAKDINNDHETSIVWNESIMFNEELISKINIKINSDTYQMHNTYEDIPTKFYAQPA
jgi:hypothetical protein